MPVGPDPIEFNMNPLLLFGAGIAAAVVLIGFFKAMAAACRMVAAFVGAGQ